MASVTRREFFGGIFKAGRRVADVATNDEPARTEDAPRLRTEVEAIAGDFPPELLSLEAERLGLDPDSPDREALLMAVYEAMAGPNETEESGQ